MSKPKSVQEWMERNDREPYRGLLFYIWYAPAAHLCRMQSRLPTNVWDSIRAKAVFAVTFGTRDEAVEALRVALVKLGEIDEDKPMSKPKSVEEWMDRNDVEPYIWVGNPRNLYLWSDELRYGKSKLPMHVLAHMKNTNRFNTRDEAVEALRVALVKLGEIEKPKTDDDGRKPRIDDVAACDVPTAQPGTVTKVFMDAPPGTLFAQSGKTATVSTITLTDTQQAIINECNDVMKVLLEKNKAYGDSAINPVRLFSKADAMEQLNVRIDDKLSRLMRGDAAGEDVELDLIGYLVLKRVARKVAK